MPEETEGKIDSSRFMPANVDDHIGDDRMVEEPLSDANTMVTKAENDVEVQPEHEKQPEERPEDQLAQDEYPKGFQFVFILLALILSVFMVALDLVRLVRSSGRHMHADSARRQLSQRLSQRSRTSFTVFPR